MMNDVLRGWAEIEAYLGMCRNTILSKAFPVRKHGIVFAYKSELDAEAKKAPLKKRRSRARGR